MYTKKPYNERLVPGRASSLAAVTWLGDSRDVLRGFPAKIQQDLCYALYQVQLGQMPPDSKPTKTVGAGVYELRDQDERG